MIIPSGCKQIEVSIRKSGRWVVTEATKPQHKEIPDPTPIEIGVREAYDPQAEMVRSITESVMSNLANKEGQETFNEANDFNVEDEDSFDSPYELSEMQEEYEPPPPTPKKEPPASCPAASVGDSDPAVSPEPAKPAKTPPEPGPAVPAP